MVPGAPVPVSPFSHATEQDGWVFVTGQMPFSGTANDSPYPQGIEAQTHQVFANLKTVLTGIGLGLEHVLMARVYLLQFERDFLAMNTVYAGYFASDRRPARTCIGVSGLARGALIEIDFVARRPG
jgi:reactive intermediate/imine deaminase